MEILEMWIDTADRPLGAYAVRLTFDPAAAGLEAITGGGGPFGDAPLSRPETYGSGDVRFAGRMGDFRTTRLPGGLVRVATLRFRVLPGRRTALAAELESCFDPDGKPVPARTLLSRERLGDAGP